MNESDVTGSPLRDGVQTMVYERADMFVTVVIPGTAAMVFRGRESDDLALTEWTSRDRQVAKALLLDALNRLNATGQPMPIAPSRTW